MLPDFHAKGQGNPHADAEGNPVWHFLDVTREPTLLTEFVKDAAKTPGLLVWRGAEPDLAVLANANAQPVAWLTVRQPARSLAVHPGPRGGVAVAWQSPIDGVVSVKGRVQDVDSSGGDGIAWTLAHRPGFGKELAEARAVVAAWTQARTARAAFQQSLEQSPDRAYAVAEGKPHNARIHKRGDPQTLGPEVPRRFLQVLGGQGVPPGTGSGRLELAGWLTDPQNPLTARVMVNRVWQGHFGTGLVETPNDFGTRGEPPTHPELLDYLAARFVEAGWSVKALHRLIVLSDASQRAGSHDAANALTDPDNSFLWRFNRRRLSGEEIRDAMLAVSGDLDGAPGGPHPFPAEKTWGFTQHAPFAAVYDHNRRSVYLMTQRIKWHPFLALFDGPDTSSSTAARYTTTVPTQALFFLNDPFVHARAAGLAGRLVQLPDDSARLARATWLLYGRAPTAKESEAARRLLAACAAEGAGPETAWAAWLRVMFSSNEFVYVD